MGSPPPTTLIPPLNKTRSAHSSGRATPTRYGSFESPDRFGSPALPGTSHHADANAADLSDRLRGALRKDTSKKKAKLGRRVWDTHAREIGKRTSTASLGQAGPGGMRQLNGSTGLGRDVSSSTDEFYNDVYDYSDDSEDEHDGNGGEGDTSDAASARGPLLGPGGGGGGGGGARKRTEDDEDKQWGVKKMEIMGRYWGKKGLLTLYAGVYLISIFLSLEGNTTPTVEPYFLSLLNSHSLLGAVSIVTSIAHAVGKPPLTKILDVFGRAEGIALSAVFYSVGYILTATAKDVRVYVAARAISSLGGQGLQMGQQIIVADTTTLTNRGLITSTISLPWIATTWLGPPLGSWFQSLGEVGYRSAYGVFGVLIPLISSVLIGTLWFEWRKARKIIKTRWMVRERRPSEASVNPVAVEEVKAAGGGWRRKSAEVWQALDIVGLLCLTVGCSLVLLPLTLAAQRPAAWKDVETHVLIALGIATLIFFGYYEAHWSPVPLLPQRILHNRTVMCASYLGFFHFCSQFCYESFFTSFLQVARHYTPRNASYVSESYIFSASVAAIVAGICAKYTQRYKWIGVSGVLIHMVGTWLMMRLRNLDSPTWELVLSQVVGGIGGGFTTIAAQIGCQSVVGHQDVGIATATFLTITQVGGAVGSALAGAVWSTLLPTQLHARLPASDQPLIPEILASLPYTLSFPPGTPTRIAINESYVAVQRVLNFLAMAFLIPALVSMLCMKNTHLEREDQGQGEGVVVLGRASILGPSEEEESVSSETSSLLGSV
ncbi:hypothetical protein MNV49_000670 [Pseudohyphozyma bogoriensis]|nr:hypothetical protein MNV49_000670 [Pseudohyphozyma bogoriensis]